MPARHRRSSISRTNSRAANVSATLRIRKIAQTGCETSKAPRWRAAALAQVDLHVDRRDDAEDDGEDAADEHGEEIVDARAAAPQPVESLQLEAERHQHRDERQHVDVLLQRRHALGDRDQLLMRPLWNRSS